MITESNSLKMTFSIKRDAIQFESEKASDFQHSVSKGSSSDSSHNSLHEGETDSKKRKRLLQNRQSAARCRQKKKDEIQRSAMDLSELTIMNKKMEERVSKR
jgi:hypothetical protein